MPESATVQNGSRPATSRDGVLIRAIVAEILARKSPKKRIAFVKGVYARLASGEKCPSLTSTGNDRRIAREATDWWVSQMLKLAEE
jgi:hypothetical protein